MATLVPKVLSPQAHRRFDLFALPGVVAGAVWMSRRDRAAAAVMLMVADALSDTQQAERQRRRG